MKKLGLIGVIIGVAALLLGVYLEFFLVPASQIAETSIDFGVSQLGDRYYGSAEHFANLDAIEAIVDYGIYLMGAGLLAFLLSIVPAIKKQHIAWVGVLLGAITFFWGAAHGTHMFS